MLSSTEVYCGRSPFAFILREGEQAVMFHSLSLKAFNIPPAFANRFESDGPFSEEERAWLQKEGFHTDVAGLQAARKEADFLHQHPDPSFINSYRILLTEKCNLACTYCFEHTLSNPTKMESEMLLKVLDRIAERHPVGDFTLHWFGGEPFLKFPLIQEGMKYIHSLSDPQHTKIYHSFTTHGGLITPKIAEFLSQYESRVFVSLDGRPEVNDLHRVDFKGRSTYDAAVRGYNMLLDAGVDAGILMTPVGKVNGHLFDSVQHFVEDLDCKWLGINTPQPTPEGWELDGELFAEQVFEITQYCIEKGVQLSTPYQGIIHSLHQSQPSLHDCRSQDGSMGVAISPEGKLGFCIVSWESPQHSTDIFEADAFKEAEKWKLESHVTEQCKGCIAEMVCGGPCALEAELGKLDPQRCGFYQEGIRLALLKGA